MCSLIDSLSLGLFRLDIFFPLPLNRPLTFVLCVLLFLIFCFCYLFSSFFSCISPLNSLMLDLLFCFVLFFSLCTLSHTHIHQIGMLADFSGKCFRLFSLCYILLTHFVHYNFGIDVFFCVWVPSSNWQCVCIGFAPLRLHYLFSCIYVNIEQFGDTFFVFFFFFKHTVAFINIHVPYACSFSFCFVSVHIYLSTEEEEEVEIMVFYELWILF